MVKSVKKYLSLIVVLGFFFQLYISVLSNPNAGDGVSRFNYGTLFYELIT